MSYDFGQRHSDAYDPEPEPRPVPGVDYDEGECMLCGRSESHDVNECARKEFEQPTYMIAHFGANFAAYFGPFDTTEEAHAFALENKINPYILPMYKTVDWNRR